MGQLLFLGLAFLVGGFMSSLFFILEKRKGSKNFCTTLAPARDIIGVVVLAIGVYALIRSFSMINAPMIWITILFPILILIVNGLILGEKLIAKMVKISFLDKIKGFQIPLGWMSLGFGIFLVLASFSISSIPGMMYGHSRSYSSKTSDARKVRNAIIKARRARRAQRMIGSGK